MQVVRSRLLVSDVDSMGLSNSPGRMRAEPADPRLPKGSGGTAIASSCFHRAGTTSFSRSGTLNKEQKMTRYREPNHGETDQSRYPEQNECFVSKKLLRKESLHAHQHDNDREPRLSGGMSSGFGTDMTGERNADK